MEQGTGVEPASAAWEAAVLPMYEPCVPLIIAPHKQKIKGSFLSVFAHLFCLFLRKDFIRWGCTGEEQELSGRTVGMLLSEMVLHL